MEVDVSNLPELGRRIRHLRKQLGLSQEAVAEPRYTAAYISHVERGTRRPSQEVLSHIASKLGLTLEQLVTGRDPHEELRLEIEIQAAISQIYGGDVDDAVARLELASQRARELRGQRALLRAQEGLGLGLYRRGELDRALGVFKSAADLAASGLVEERTSAVVGQSKCLFRIGEVAEALHLLESHLVELERAESPDPTALIQTYAALIPPYYANGLLQKAREMADRGWKIAPQVPEPDERACLYVNRAGLLLTEGEPRAALASLALAEDLFRHLGWYAERVKVSLMRALALVEQEDLDGGEAELRDILTIDGAPLQPSDHGQALVHLAELRRRRGDPSEALALARDALDVVGSDLPTIVAEANREAGICAEALGDSAAAITYWTDALRIFRELNNTGDVARTARLLGDHLSRRGDVDGALAAYREGLEAMKMVR